MREPLGVGKSAKLEAERKGNGENLFDHEEHEGVEGVETTGKNIFTMKDMKSMKEGMGQDEHRFY